MANQVIVTANNTVQVSITPTPTVEVQISRAAITSVTDVANANSANYANYANFAGQVTSANQPNITTLGNLVNISVSNTITTQNLVVNGNLQVGNLVANTANYANFAGTVLTNAQPNITSLGTLTGLSINGTVTGNIIPSANVTYDLGNNTNRFNDLYLSGNTIYIGSQNITSNATSITLSGVLAGDGGALSNITGANVTGTVANANYANIAGTAYSVSVGNVSGIGNIATVNLDGNVSNVLRGDGTFGAGSTGNVANANYANFAGIAYSVSGSNVSGAVANAVYADNAGNANIANTAYSVSGANVVGEVAVANTVSNPNQSNITTVGTLGNLAVTGNITANVITANYINANVSFGNVDYIQFDTANVGPGAVAQLTWNDGDGTLDLGLKGGNVTLQIGEQQYARVHNNAANTLVKGEVVYVTGAAGNRVAVSRAQANAEATSTGTIGFAAENISAGQEGFVITAGALYKLNTLGYTAGATVYLSPSVAGGWTTTKPTAPNQLVVLGWIERVSATVGSIYIKVDNGYELDELHNVLISNVATGQALVYNGSNLWVNGNPNFANTAGTVTTNAQPNITSVGTLANLDISNTGRLLLGNIELTESTANFGFINTIGIVPNVANASFRSLTLQGSAITSLANITDATVTSGTARLVSGAIGTTANRISSNTQNLVSSTTSVAGSTAFGSNNSTRTVQGGGVTISSGSAFSADSNNLVSGNISVLAGNPSFVVANNVQGGTLTLQAGVANIDPTALSFSANSVNIAQTQIVHGQFNMNRSNGTVSTVRLPFLNMSAAFGLGATFSNGVSNINIANVIPAADWFWRTPGVGPSFGGSGGNLNNITIGNITTPSLNIDTGSFLYANGSNVSNYTAGNVTTGNITIRTGIATNTSSVTNTYTRGDIFLNGRQIQLQANTTGNTAGTGTFTFDANNTATLGNLVVSNYFSGNGSLLTGVVANTANTANYANYAGDVINASQANITTVGNLTSLQIGNGSANTATTTFTPVGANITTLSGDIFVNNKRVSYDDVNQLANGVSTQDAIIMPNDTGNGIGQDYVVNYLVQDLANISNIATMGTETVGITTGYTAGDMAAPGQRIYSLYSADSQLANANPNTTVDITLGGTGMFINQKMPNQNNGPTQAGLIGTMNYGEVSDPSSATGIVFQRRRGNNSVPSGGGITRAPVQANDYLGNIAWRGAGSATGSINSGRAIIGAKVDSSYGGPGNAMPIGMELIVVNNSNTQVIHSFYANGNVNISGAITANGTITATNIGNVANTNFNGNGSTVLLGNGVFGTAPAGTPTSIQNGNSVVDFTGSGGDLRINIDGRQYATFNYNRQLTLEGVEGDYANASQIKLDNGGIQVINENLGGGLASFEFKSYYSSGAIAPYVFQRARGNLVAPANAQSGDAIMNQSFQAYSGSGFASAGSFSATVTNNDNAGNVRTRIELLTNNNNDSSEIKLNTDVINLAGNSVIYLTATNSNVSGNLNVANNVSVTGTANIANTNLNRFQETVYAYGNATGTITPDFNNGSIQNLTLTGNITLNSLGNAVAGRSMTLILTQDSNGSRLLSSTMKFAGASKTLTTTANAIDIISVFYDGATYYATLSKGYA